MSVYKGLGIEWKQHTRFVLREEYARKKNMKSMVMNLKNIWIHVIYEIQKRENNQKDEMSRINLLLMEMRAIEAIG